MGTERGGGGGGGGGGGRSNQRTNDLRFVSLMSTFSPHVRESTSTTVLDSGFHA